MSSIVEEAEEIKFALNLSYNKLPFEITNLSGSTTVLELKEKISSIIDIPVGRIKLLFKVVLKNENNLEFYKIKETSKIGIMASRESVPDPVVSKNKVVLEAAKPVSTSQTSKYTFHNLQVLPNHPNEDKAIEYLEKLRDDIGIKALLNHYKWSIPNLIELSPLEHTILGYNRNKGETIALRLRTSDFQGFIHYPEVKRVMIHELAHMVHSEHNADFHQFNRLLTQQVKEFDWTKSQGYTLQDGKVRNYNNSYTTSAQNSSSVFDTTKGKRLGGGGSFPTSRQYEAMREKMLKAAEKRLSKEEREVTEGCGSAPSNIKD